MIEEQGIGAVLIAGPTASGKSALALELAEEFGGVIINADSMQVYRELRIITNRPTPGDEARAPHRLYGFRSAAEPYSTAQWLNDVKPALAEAAAEGRLPVIVGGTGLYFKALTEGLSEIPEIPTEIRKRFRQAAQISPPEALHRQLAERDPLTASRIRPSDPQRIVRALEVLEATGQPLAEWQAQRQPPIVRPDHAFCLSVEVEREELYRRCDERFDAMLSHGAADEAKAILALGLSDSLPAMRAVGLPELLSYLRGELSLEEARTVAKVKTRQYAKRQLTWIRGNFSNWNSINTKYSERIKRELILFLQKGLTSKI
jgi:tRNA dimethylallyltransferase